MDIRREGGLVGFEEGTEDAPCYVGIMMVAVGWPRGGGVRVIG